MKLDVATVKCEFFDEPSLAFAAERLHLCPKRGITLFGPRSLDMGRRHPDTVRVGFVGTGETIDAAQQWLMSCAEGVLGDSKNYGFPGFKADRGFLSDLAFSDDIVESLTIHELQALKKLRRRERFEAAIDLLSNKLRLLSETERPPDYVVLALPAEIVKWSGTVDYFDKEQGEVHRDLRRAIKAMAMRHRLPTQILLERTTRAPAAGSKGVDHKTKCAWNFFTGLYYKTGGIPWVPSALPRESCFVGISFHRPLGSANSTYFTGLAQAFDEEGNGLVLRGQEFVWDTSKHGNSPHIPAELAQDLIACVLQRYRDEMKRSPRRVVVHKTTEYWPEEREGFLAALKDVNEFDLVAVRPTDDIRLLRDARYPILRGSYIAMADLHLLYTTGYISSLQSFPHGHVPLPIRLTDHIGDSSVRTVLQEMMVLTKMNWNSANFGGLLPITLRFARLVGDIMKEVPQDQDPLPQFKYYM